MANCCRLWAWIACSSTPGGSHKPQAGKPRARSITKLLAAGIDSANTRYSMGAFSSESSACRLRNCAAASHRRTPVSASVCSSAASGSSSAVASSAIGTAVHW